jgi:Ca2+-binding RTX toxin-like protein
MGSLTRFGIGEVVGTGGPDRFRGKADIAFYGRAGADVFTAGPAAILEEDQFFLGGSGNDTYVLPSGTGAIIGEGFGSGRDRITTPGIGYGSESTFALEIDGRHLAVVDAVTETEFIILDWLDPARRIEIFEGADGTFQFGRDITAATVRSDENYLGNFSWEELTRRAGEFLEPKYTASEARQILNGVLARADGLETTDGAAGPGDDVLLGTAGADTIDGLAGNDQIRGVGGDDRLIGGAGADRVLGGAGNDRLEGGQGDDALFGGAHRDRLDGGGGNDILVGGPGGDTLTGGPGADVFLFTSIRDATDRITDFRLAAGDRIDLAAVLEGFVPGTSDPDGFIRLVERGETTALRVDPNGGGDGFIRFAVLQGIAGASLDDLISGGSLVVDPSAGA